MAQQILRKEEAIGLSVAIAAHVGLVAFLLLKPLAPPTPPPERMTVTLSEDVSLTSTAPHPAPDAAPDTAPEQGEPAPVPSPAPPQPKAEAVPPLPRLLPVPPKPVTRSIVPPKPAPPAAKPAPSKPFVAQPAVKPAVRPGASKFSDMFSKGIPGATGKTQSPNPPAVAVGPAVKSALAGAISRQLKPKWVAPQGAEADRLVTILSWELNPDGSLAGSPHVVRQEGITDANRAQAPRHAEQAIRAVRLAAPFDLPPEYYAAWKRIAEFRFDRRLSQ